MVMHKAEMDEALGLAYRLAYFLHGDRETALLIVTRAASKLEVAAATQHKRLYYRLAGRPSAERGRSAGFRNRVSFSELHLLQRLVYIESEPFERERWAGGRGAPDRDEALAYYIKHLVRISLKRNSFYVTLGVSRLLYGYTTPETMELYSAVLQDPERWKDDYYYRSRKAVLMQELKRRFGDLLRVSRGSRGEEGFEPYEWQEGLAGLVEECLSFLTPWHTLCPVPANWNQLNEALPTLDGGAGAEDEAEVNRIHAVLHPGCLQRLTAALAVDAPGRRLRVPHFFLSSDNDAGGDNPRRDPPALRAEDLLAIKGELEEQARRRRNARIELLRIFVDGEERAGLDPRLSTRVSFRVGRNAELIEVRASHPQGELLLATHLLNDSEDAPHARAAVKLEDGTAITFALNPTRGREAGWLVEVGRTAGGPRTRLRSYARALAAWLGVHTTTGRRWRPRLATALAASLLLLCVAGLALWVRTRNSAGEEMRGDATNAARPDEGTPPSAPASPTASPSLQVEETRLQNGNGEGGTLQAGRGPKPKSALPTSPGRGHIVHGLHTARGGATPDESGAGVETLRSPSAPAGNVSLTAARKICVLAEGSEPEATDLSRQLTARLAAGGRLTPVQDLEAADVCLKLSVARADAGDVGAGRRLTVVARLVSAEGSLLRLSPRHAGAVEYRGAPARIVALIDADLREEIRRAGGDR